MYDLVLDAALAGDGCGPARLQVGGEWAWLLNQVASHYGIKDTYQRLAHVKWLVRYVCAHGNTATPLCVRSADIYTMTGPCLELLFSQLELLKQSADTGSLLPREELIYSHTVQVVESLIAQVFECYFTAGDAQGLGGQEGEAQAAVLRPAVELFKRTAWCIKHGGSTYKRRTVLKDCNNPADRAWLCDRLCIAAHRQYNKLAFNAEQEQGVLADGHPGHHGQPAHRRATSAAGYESAAAAAAAAGAVQSYRIVDVLCDKVQAELTNDCHLAARGLLPAFVNLPLITANEYCKVLLSGGHVERCRHASPPFFFHSPFHWLLFHWCHTQELNQRLTSVLAKYPPAIPSNDAVDLLVSVGRLQRYLDTHGLSEGAEGGARIDANRIFGKHVRDWFAKSKDILLTALRTHANVSYVTTSPKQLCTCVVWSHCCRHRFALTTLTQRTKSRCPPSSTTCSSASRRRRSATSESSATGPCLAPCSRPSCRPRSARPSSPSASSAGWCRPTDGPPPTASQRAVLRVVCLACVCTRSIVWWYQLYVFDDAPSAQWPRRLCL